MALMQHIWDHGYFFFAVPTARVGSLTQSIGATRTYKDYCPPHHYNSTAYLTCTQQKHYTSLDILQ